MILFDQYLTEESTWLLSIGIILALSFMLMYLSKGDLTHFLVFATITSALFVWVGLVEIWVLVLFSMFCIINLGYQLKTGASNGE